MTIIILLLPADVSQSRLEASAEATALSLHLLLVSFRVLASNHGQYVCYACVQEISEFRELRARYIVWGFRCESKGICTGEKKSVFVVPRIQEARLLFVVNFGISLNVMTTAVNYVYLAFNSRGIAKIVIRIHGGNDVKECEQPAGGSIAIKLIWFAQPFSMIHMHSIPRTHGSTANATLIVCYFSLKKKQKSNE